MRRIAVTVATLAVTAAALLVPSAANAQTPAASAGHHVSALKLLRHLPVRPERNAGYDRDKFSDWDYVGDYCDVRDVVLIAESTVKPRVTGECHITGKWFSVYDGARTRDSSTFDVDHLVPMAEAWGSGARSWTTARRDRFSNDLGYRYSLVAVSASSNRSKGDGDPTEWLPSRRTYWCAYAKQYTAVKWRWRLAVDRAEKAELRQLIRGCPSRTVLRPNRA